MILTSYTDQFLMGLIEFMIWAKWLLLLAMSLVVGDFKFGIAASRRRKLEIKRSRALRRTLDKISAYVLWIMIAYLFGHAFGQPFGIELLPLVILLVIYGVELESIYVNYFAAKGKSVKVNVFKLFSKKTDLIDIEKDEIK